MELTPFLAKIIGIYAVVGGLSGLLYPARMQKAMAEVTRSYLLPYFDGVLALIVGLALVLTHNLWGSPVEVIISLVGWIALIEGFAMLLLPHSVIASVARAFTAKGVVTSWSVLALVVGAYLTYMSLLM